MENKLYRDTETGTIYTTEQIQDLYTEFLGTCDNTDAWTFDAWVQEVTGKNGTMEEYTRPTLKELLVECMENMSTSELVYLHNNYCDADGYSDDHIYRMSEFDNVMSGDDPHSIACNVFYGDFCPAHEFFWFNGYGNLESADFIQTDGVKPVCLSDIADYIERERDSLYNSDIQDIIDEYDENEEEQDNE